MQKIMQVQGNPGSEYVEIGILYIYMIQPCCRCLAVDFG